MNDRMKAPMPVNDKLDHLLDQTIENDGFEFDRRGKHQLHLFNTFGCDVSLVLFTVSCSMNNTLFCKSDLFNWQCLFADRCLYRSAIYIQSGIDPTIRYRRYTTIGTLQDKTNT